MNPDGEQRKSKIWRGILEWIFTIAIALLIALPIRHFIAEPFIVSGASMDPTFASGQFLIVDRLSYNFGSPQRGDVVVFKYPHDPKTYYIKRIIGLPGESLTMTDGKIRVTPATTVTTSTSTSTTPTSTSDVSTSSAGFILDESYIDAAHVSHDGFSVTLDLDHYFVLGDNRTQSSDSRAWGPLDRNLIIGKPFVRILPLSSISLFPGKVEER